MKQLIVIVGPTASGKTAKAIELAKQYSTEIVSADSRQIYTELTIGTAKPSVEQLAEIPHHFINFISIAENYNAGRFEIDALALIEKLFAKHDILVMTGGSGLYINAVLQGFDDLPEENQTIRKQLRNQYELNGISFLQQLLLEKDADYYQKIDLQNPQRLMRALEVCLATGTPYSTFLQNRKGKNARNFSTKVIGINMDRAQLYNRIEQRVDEMIKLGLLDEVKSVLKYKHHNALQTVGYKEMIRFLDGNISLEEVIELIKKNTRNYAKRQLTWFRKMENVEWI